MPWEGALLPGAKFLSGLVCLCYCRMGPFPGGGAGISLTLQIETGGWAWGGAYNSDSLEILKISFNPGECGAGWQRPCRPVRWNHSRSS